MRAMSPPTSRILLLLALALPLALGGCMRGESNVEAGNREGILHYGNGAEPQGLDPHVVTGVPENKLVRALELVSG